MSNLRILTVAPYSEFHELTSRIADEFPDVCIDVFTGDRSNALSYLETLSLQKYSAIISRGGTAEFLRRSVAIPVIEVEVSVYDMLRTLKQAESFNTPFAIAGYPSIVRLARNLCEILRYQNVEILEVTSENVDEQMRLLRQQGIDLIVGDVMSTEAAAKYGIRSILITSSTDSVRKAIVESVELCRNMQAVLSENQLMQAAANTLPMGILLLDSKGNAVMSNAAARTIGLTPLLRMLTPLLPLLRQQDTLSRLQTVEENTYSLRGMRLIFGEQEYFLFTTSETSRSLSAPTGITVENLSDFPKDIHFLFSNSTYIQPVLKNLESFKDSHTPILITGQIGTEKISVARYLHWNSGHKNHPFVRIRCDLLTPACWDAFCSAPNGPVEQSGCTLFFENVHTLSPRMQSELESFLAGTFVLKRQYVVSSTPADLQGMVVGGMFSPHLYEHLAGLSIHMPSLNERREDIPSLANLFIARLNGEYGKQVIGFEDDAIDILKNYRWTLNLEQLRRVLTQLVSGCDDYYITAAELRSALEATQPIDLGSSRLLPIDLSQPLDRIEQDIIRHILAEEGMNQSAAAKRLGIGRSTIWRKLQH